MSMKTRLHGLAHKLPEVAKQSGAGEKLALRDVKKAAQLKILTPAQAAVLTFAVSRPGDHTIDGIRQQLDSYLGVFKAADKAGTGSVSKSAQVKARDDFELWRMAKDEGSPDAAALSRDVIKRKGADGTREAVFGVGSLLGKLQALRDEQPVSTLKSVAAQFDTATSAAARQAAANDTVGLARSLDSLQAALTATTQLDTLNRVPAGILEQAQPLLARLDGAAHWAKNGVVWHTLPGVLRESAAVGEALKFYAEPARPEDPAWKQQAARLSTSHLTARSALDLMMGELVHFSSGSAVESKSVQGNQVAFSNARQFGRGFNFARTFTLTDQGLFSQPGEVLTGKRGATANWVVRDPVVARDVFAKLAAIPTGAPGNSMYEVLASAAGYPTHPSTLPGTGWIYEG